MNDTEAGNTTCTACGGTILMEFAALSQLTGDPVYEVRGDPVVGVANGCGLSIEKGPPGDGGNMELSSFGESFGWYSSECAQWKMDQ